MLRVTLYEISAQSVHIAKIILVQRALENILKEWEATVGVPFFKAEELFLHEHALTLKRSQHQLNSTLFQNKALCLKMV